MRNIFFHSEFPGGFCLFYWIWKGLHNRTRNKALCLELFIFVSLCMCSEWMLFPYLKERTIYSLFLRNRYCRCRLRISGLPLNTNTDIKMVLIILWTYTTWSHSVDYFFHDCYVVYSESLTEWCYRIWHNIISMLLWSFTKFRTYVCHMLKFTRTMPGKLYTINSA